MERNGKVWLILHNPSISNYFLALQVARPEGFEPPTHGFVVRCSIQTELRARFVYSLNVRPYYLFYTPGS